MSTEESTEETPQDTPEGTETPEEAQRRKFREALEKKKQGHHGEGMAPKGSAQLNPSQVHAQQRMHRRKSG